MKTGEFVGKLENKKGRRGRKIGRKCDRSSVSGVFDGIDDIELRKQDRTLRPYTLNAAPSIDNTCYTGAAIINYSRARREIAILLDNVTELEHAKITVGFLFAARPLTSYVFFKSRFHSLF